MSKVRFADDERIEYNEEWLTIPEKADGIQKLHDRIHVLDTLLNYEMKNLPNDRKTYVQQGQIFFLRPQESVRKNMNNEIVETDKKIRLQQDQLYTLQHQFQLYRQQEQAEKR